MNEETNLEFDGFLFGNGLSINLLSQINSFIDDEKKYLLNFDKFIKNFFDNALSEREERLIFNFFYKKKTIENIKYFEKLKIVIKNYYSKRDGNIEYWFGRDMFENNDYDFSSLKNFMPPLYNIWNFLLTNYLEYMKLNKKIQIYNESISNKLTTNALVFTTNFDTFFESLFPQHLHGYFITNCSDVNNLVFSHINDKKFYWKILWGWNGLGKYNQLLQMQKYQNYNKYYNLDFFNDKKITINNFLIYGLSFQRVGYIDLLPAKGITPKHFKKGELVDDHILFRIAQMQETGNIKNLHIAYYNIQDLVHYKKIVDLYNLKHISFINSSTLEFKI